MKKLILTFGFILSFIVFVFSGTAFAGTCTPVINSDGTVTVKFFNAVGATVVEQNFKQFADVKGNGISSSRMTVTKMLKNVGSKQRDGRIKRTVPLGPKLKHTRRTPVYSINHTHGKPAVDVGGCKLAKVNILAAQRFTYYSPGISKVLIDQLSSGTVLSGAVLSAQN